MMSRRVIRLRTTFSSTISCAFDCHQDGMAVACNHGICMSGPTAMPKYNCGPAHPADLNVERIGDLLNYDVSTLLAANREFLRG